MYKKKKAFCNKLKLFSGICPFQKEQVSLETLKKLADFFSIYLIDPNHYKHIKALIAGFANFLNKQLTHHLGMLQLLYIAVLGRIYS